MVNGSTVVVFDDERAVANAGVMLPALLARWPWATEFLAALRRLRALPPPP